MTLAPGWCWALTARSRSARDPDCLISAGCGCGCPGLAFSTAQHTRSPGFGMASCVLVAQPLSSLGGPLYQHVLTMELRGRRIPRSWIACRWPSVALFYFFHFTRS